MHYTVTKTISFFSVNTSETGQNLRANAYKNQAKLKFRGQSLIFFFAVILPMDRYWSVIKRKVVFFQKGRFNLEKINKIYFCCRRLQAKISDELGFSQNFACMQKGRKRDKIFSDA